VSAPASSPSGPGRRILLFAEAVTLAHVARPLCFAAGLDGGGDRVAIAVAPHASAHVEAAGLPSLELESIAPEQFLSALACGRALYDAKTLQRYVRADLAAIERFGPDLVVGDFRLSLSVSARLARVPYVSIASAYWSPHYTPPSWPVPDLPLTRRLPLGLAQAIFAAARPLAFALHCGPLNAVRARHGMPPLPRDLRRIYTDADWVAYSDLPELFPMQQLPPSHRFLGPALWQPAVERPVWWEEIRADRPCVYVTLGSSGDASLLPTIVEALAALPVTLLVAAAGMALPAPVPGNVLHAAYLPGLEAARKSQLVICNGGNLTAYQGLAGGAAVLGIAGNLDQFLNMQALERAGAGVTLRADRLDAKTLRAAAERLLGDTARAGPVDALRRRCEACRFDLAARELAAQVLGR
jgi:UDP:flavonoid glycosyltransferase YjiC (YdhE family)